MLLSLELLSLELLTLKILKVEARVNEILKGEITDRTWYFYVRAYWNKLKKKFQSLEGFSRISRESSNSIFSLSQNWK